MSNPLPPGARRVVHANRFRSYGVGEIVESGERHARVQFDGERAERTVCAADLSAEPALPLAVRQPHSQVIWPPRRPG